MTNAALGQLTVASVPAGQAGLGSGANNTARYLGGAAGIAVVAATRERALERELVAA